MISTTKAAAAKKKTDFQAEVPRWWGRGGRCLHTGGRGAFWGPTLRAPAHPHSTALPQTCTVHVHGPHPVLEVLRQQLRQVPPQEKPEFTALGQADVAQHGLRHREPRLEPLLDGRLQTFTPQCCGLVTELGEAVHKRT